MNESRSAAGTGPSFADGSSAYTSKSEAKCATSLSHLLGIGPAVYCEMLAVVGEA